MALQVLRCFEAPMPNSPLRGWLQMWRSKYDQDRKAWERMYENFWPDFVTYLRGYNGACYKIDIIDEVLMATPWRPVRIEELRQELASLYGNQFDRVRFHCAWAAVSHLLMHSAGQPDVNATPS